MQIICLFFPAFVALKKAVDKKDRIIDIITKYAIYNAFVNLITLLIIKVFRNADYVIGSGSFTVPFSINYLAVSIVIAFILPRIVLYMKKNVEISVGREKWKK